MVYPDEQQQNEKQYDIEGPFEMRIAMLAFLFIFIVLFQDPEFYKTKVKADEWPDYKEEDGDVKIS